jgi:hypothetical protein
MKPSFTLKVVCILFAWKHWYHSGERYLVPFIDACAGPIGFIRHVIKMQHLLVLKNNLANIVHFYSRLNLVSPGSKGI